MFGFVKKAFITAMTFFNLWYVNSLECISNSNEECKARSKIIEKVIVKVMNSFLPLNY